MAYAGVEEDVDEVPDEQKEREQLRHRRPQSERVVVTLTTPHTHMHTTHSLLLFVFKVMHSDYSEALCELWIGIS